MSNENISFNCNSPNMYTILETVAKYPPWMAEGRAAKISLQDPADDVDTSVVSRKVQTGSQFPHPPTTRRTYTVKLTSVVPFAWI